MASITTRAGKGSPLTNAEVDANFTNLNADKFEVPTQTGNAGKFLTTNGTAASWGSVPAPNNGTLTLGVSGAGLSGSATFTADQAGGSTFTVTSNATSANTSSALVARDASGNFSAGTITAALSGNATTATTLQTARTIGGVSFNGSANINLPGVNTAGDQNTSGTAAISTAATVTTSATASAFKVPFANTTVSTTGNYGLLQDSEATFTYNPSTNTLVAGTFSGALSGNATTATTLQTARTLTIGSTGKTFNGSANVAWTVAEIGAVGLTGNQTVQDVKTFKNVTVEQYTELLHAPAAGAAFTVDLANGPVQKFITNANTTITLPASVAGKSFVLFVEYGGVHTITWAGGASIEWSGGTAPSATAVSGKVDAFTFFQDGSVTYGAAFGQNF